MASKRIMKCRLKKIDDVHSKYSGLLALLSGEPISASAKSVLLALPLNPAGGLGGSQTPRLLGASGPECRLLTLILRLLQIILTTLLIGERPGC